MGAGVCRGNPRALCCSQFTAGVHPSPCWLGAPIIPGMVPYLIKITPCIPSLHNLLCILQDAWKGPVLLGGHSGVLSPAGTPVLLAAAGSTAKPQRGVWAPLHPCSLPEYFWLCTWQATCSPPPLPVGTVILGKRRRQRRSCQGCGAAFGPGTAPLRVGKPGFALRLFHPFCVTAEITGAERGLLELGLVVFQGTG